MFILIHLLTHLLLQNLGVNRRPRPPPPLLLVSMSYISQALCFCTRPSLKAFYESECNIIIFSSASSIIVMRSTAGVYRELRSRFMISMDGLNRELFNIFEIDRVCGKMVSSICDTPCWTRALVQQVDILKDWLDEPE
jgi:hypothetical protein